MGLDSSTLQHYGPALRQAINFGSAAPIAGTTFEVAQMVSPNYHGRLHLRHGDRQHYYLCSM